MGISNSPLVTYTKLSPNCTKPRNNTIDTITIHTMAGNLSVETCGELFADPKREASSNYGIDSNGRIAMYVEEQNRSWCSSNKSNYMRSVTIEVASINNKDYKCSDKAYKSLVELCADICRRNNINKLIWSTDKNTRINHLNGCNMTVHRDFKNKSCPGEWLYDNMSRIADDVNARLGLVSYPIIPDHENEEEAMYEFLKSKGESNYFIFGLMGNIYAESGIRANNLQNSYEKKLGMSDEEYTIAVDNGSYPNFTGDKAGNTKRSIGSPEMQREFLWIELTTKYKGMLNQLRSATSIKQASDIVLTQFEKPADQSDNVKNKRASYGQMLYEKYGDDKDLLPWRVRIIDDSLNIRNNPGTNGTKITGCIKDHGVYTIIETSNVGNTTWGKLKSGLGWICLTKYTQRV